MDLLVCIAGLLVCTAGTVEAPGQLAVDSWVQMLFDRMHEAYRANRCGVRRQMDA